jgi:putative transposase
MTSVLMSLLARLCGAARSRAALHLEILALRHQLQALQRSRPLPLSLTTADRWLGAWLSAAWSGWQTAVLIVKPETVIAWHRQASGCSGPGGGADETADLRWLPMFGA